MEEIRRFGVAVTTRRREEDDCISYTDRIPKSAKRSGSQNTSFRFTRKFTCSSH